MSFLDEKPGQLSGPGKSTALGCIKRFSYINFWETNLLAYRCSHLGRGEKKGIIFMKNLFILYLS
jgi:hypothetical protein